MAYRIAEFLGDGIGEELRRAVHALVEAYPFEVRFDPVVDLSLGGREAPNVFDRAVAAVEETGVALKYPTTTVTESPNQILRKRLDLSVIHRPVVTIPGVETRFDGHIDLDIVRVATGGTYEDPGRLIGDEAAVSLRIVERGPSLQAARFAFDLARKLGKRVTSTSKYTIQRITDGLFESIVEEVDEAYPDVDHRKELFDAILAKIVLKPEDFEVVLCLNEYGDFLSDMACGLVGSMGLGASGNYAFDDEGSVRLALFDAAHGTAPDIAGKGVANPTAIFFAFELLLAHLDETEAARITRETILTLLKSGRTTPDLGGTLSTSDFTGLVASGIREHLD